MRPRTTGAIAVLALFVTLAACGDGGGSPSEDAGAAGGEIPADARGGDTGGSSSPAVAGEGEVPMTLTVSVGGRSYEASGPGECRFTDPASIYDVLSSMWMVGYSGEGEVEQLRLTLWRPKGGGADQIGLSLRTAAGEHEIDTVTGDGTTSGSATVDVQTRAEGGTLVVDGRDADGTPVRVEVECSTFTGIEAVGG